MESDRMFRAGLFDCTFDGNLVSDPPCTDEIALDESNAMLQGEVVDFLAIDDRDHDLVVANDVLPSSRCERQGICARTLDCFVIHRDDPEITLFISMSDVIVAWRGSEEHPLANLDVLI